MSIRVIVAIFVLGSLSGAALAQDAPRQVLRTAGPGEAHQMPQPPDLYVPPRYPPRHWNPVGGYDSKIHSYGDGINVASPMPHASVPSW